MQAVSFPDPLLSGLGTQDSHGGHTHFCIPCISVVMSTWGNPAHTAIMSKYSSSKRLRTNSRRSDDRMAANCSMVVMLRYME